MNGLKPSIQEKIGLQNLWSLQEALKVEIIKKESSERSKPSNFPSRASNEGSNRTFNKRQNRNQPSKENQYAKPMGNICYRCNKIGQRSNVCPEQRQANLLEAEGNQEVDYGEEEVGDDDYEGVEFTTEEGMDHLTLVLQRVL
ncbi:hypothetical protein ACFX2J_019524 [Malus domestica]